MTENITLVLIEVCLLVYMKKAIPRGMAIDMILLNLYFINSLRLLSPKKITFVIVL